MKLGGRLAAALLVEEGRRALETLGMELPESPLVQLEVRDTDDMGVWTRVIREDGNHLVLVRWDYILGLEFLEGETPVIGIKG
jgi:hypothetical protein